MGLAGKKSRRKLASDPNNTRWSRNIDTFGQRILRSQGWQPGQYLGAQDAVHADHYTAANASHIRVVLRDDNAGIGLKKGSSDECTGLGDFQDLLGRLHGKSEETIRLEQKARTDHKIHLYVERKYGGMRFVRGGLLVGDSITSEEPPEGTATLEVDEERTASEATTEVPSNDEVKERKKNEESRKRENIEELKSSGDAPKKSKRRKKNADITENDAILNNADASLVESSTALEPKLEESLVKNKPKTAKQRQGKAGDEVACREESQNTRIKKRKTKQEQGGPGTEDTAMSERKKSKKDKKRKKRQDGQANRPQAESTLSVTEPEQASRETTASGTSTPQPQAIGARRFHRTKFIAQKRAAMMDAVALNQIFMIKSAAGA